MASDPPGKRFEWVKIDDFTPGIYDFSFVAQQSPYVPAPKGAADGTGTSNTFGCVALPSGGLGPLPKITTVYAYGSSFPAGVTNLFVTLMTVNPSLDSGIPEVIIGLEGDNGTNHFTKIYSYNPNSNTATAIRNASDPTTPGIFGAPYPQWSRIIDAADSPTTTIGAPCLAFPGSVLTDANGHNGHLWVYPSDGSNNVYPWGGTPASPGTPTYSLADLNSTKASVTGQLIGYQNRLVVLSGRSYPWPTSTYDNNEQINFTDPPNSNTLGFQQETLGPEAPFGYGAMGSVSSGELFMVKKSGGADMLIGDIFSPSQVIPYPGVKSTGQFYGRAGSTNDGIVYCAQNGGAYVWNGGNTATKISKQLDDDFFDCTSTVIPSSNYGFFVYRWNDMVLTSNNYVYTPSTGAWWRLNNNNALDNTFFHYAVGNTGQTLFASPIYIQAGHNHWLSKIDATVPASAWVWTSLPIPVTPDTTHLIDVTQVTITASCPASGSTVAVYLESQSVTGALQVGPFTTPSLGLQPQTYRFNTALLGANDVVVIMQGNNSGSASAPIVHEVAFEWSPASPIPTSN